jgi:hypothetical protein
VISDTKGNIFGGFTPVEWELETGKKEDASQKSFLVTLMISAQCSGEEFCIEGRKETSGNQMEFQIRSKLL